MKTIDKEREKIRWACRRGMLECDLFLVPFFERGYDDLTAEEKDLFLQLLQESDAYLYSWLMQSEKPDNAAYEPILKKIRKYRANLP